ncbi:MULTISPECIES: GSU2403 family nucleotidyltransferase fold protein [Bradyrhizobium]|uniref:GSU2403 family nucleotidyltransferase fold protein n=1 Tax=Bradyrhizobium pachyrhizi TaxID=280333 RepID=UPI0004823865
MDFQELNNDQRREVVNSQQRFQALRDAKEAYDAHRGSLTWLQSKGREYLVRSYYDKAGLRKQASLGPRSPETEKMKADFEAKRAAAEDRLKNLRDTMERQAAVNRALGLGRVPLIGARIMRALDGFGMLGSGIRILGTNAIYGYEASSGVRLDPGLATTEDIDLLFDARGGLTFVADDDVSQSSLMKILKRVDTSFERAKQTFRAVNRDGYLVDLIKPVQSPPWKKAPDKIGSDPEDLTAVQIEGLDWLQNAPAFEAVAIDEKGQPVRIVAPDPRVWAAHKLWLSRRADREALKRQRDAAQAKAVGALVANYLTHLPFDAEQLRMLPKEVVDSAARLFAKQDSAARA